MRGSLEGAGIMVNDPNPAKQFRRLAARDAAPQ